jgi:hypothetical protein
LHWGGAVLGHGSAEETLWYQRKLGKGGIEITIEDTHP